MGFVSVTRLRIRSPLSLPLFFVHALSSNRQVRRAPGFTAGALLADAHRTFWTLTMWQDEAAMRGYMTSGAHRVAMPRLAQWCDEASVVHWQSDDHEPPPQWPEAVDRMRRDGRPSRVRRPSQTHQQMGFANPKSYTSSLTLKPL